MEFDALVEVIKQMSRDSGGAGVWTAQFLAYVFDSTDGPEDVAVEESEIEQALDYLVSMNVMERVGRNGFQAREDWLHSQGTSVEELGT